MRANGERAFSLATGAGTCLAATAPLPLPTLLFLFDLFGGFADDALVLAFNSLSNKFAEELGDRGAFEVGNDLALMDKLRVDFARSIVALFSVRHEATGG